MFPKETLLDILECLERRDIDLLSLVSRDLHALISARNDNVAQRAITKVQIAETVVEVPASALGRLFGGGRKRKWSKFLLKASSFSRDKFPRPTTLDFGYHCIRTSEVFRKRHHRQRRSTDGNDWNVDGTTPLDDESTSAFQCEAIL